MTAIQAKDGGKETKIPAAALLHATPSGRGGITLTVFDW
jgi:hypothetical protein